MVKLTHFQSPQLPTLFYTFIITSFFSQLLPFTSALSFNYTYFSSDIPNISYELSAYAENQVIKLTGNMKSQAFVDRAMYFKPMHLWDEASRNLTDFTTHFTFVIKSPDDPIYTDGLAFFLAPNGAQLPNVTKGGGLGLAFDDQERNTDVNHFVAVELDIYKNKVWDPDGERGGIDTKSMQSINPSSWPSKTAIREGQINETWISYNSSSYNLSVVFTIFNRSGNERQFLSQIIDLRDLLPEWVRFGFSAATGNTTTHILCSWDFSSSLEIDNNISNQIYPVMDISIPNPAPNPKRNSTFGLITGFCAGDLFWLVG